MTKEVYIRLRDGEKESELKMQAIDQEHQLALMDGLFKFFNLDVDFKEMANIYHRSGKAYQEFYEQMDQEEKVEHEALEVANEVLTKKIDAKSLEEAYKRANEEPLKQVEETPPVAVPEPKKQVTNPKQVSDHYITGIKYDTLNRPLYKCRYKCKCGMERNAYIKPGSKYVRCYGCQAMQKVRSATAFGEVDRNKDPEIFRDEFGNFYVGGEFEVEIKTLADIEELQTENQVG